MPYPLSFIPPAFRFHIILSLVLSCAIMLHTSLCINKLKKELEARTGEVTLVLQVMSHELAELKCNKRK